MEIINKIREWSNDDEVTLDNIISSSIEPATNLWARFFTWGIGGSLLYWIIASALYSVQLGPINIGLGLLVILTITFFLLQPYFDVVIAMFSGALAAAQKKDPVNGALKGIELYIRAVFWLVLPNALFTIIMMWPNSGSVEETKMYIFGAWALVIVVMAAISMTIAFAMKSQGFRNKIVTAVLVIAGIGAVVFMAPSVMSLSGIGGADTSGEATVATSESAEQTSGSSSNIPIISEASCTQTLTTEQYRQFLNNELLITVKQSDVFCLENGSIGNPDVFVMDGGLNDLADTVAGENLLYSWAVWRPRGASERVDNYAIIPNQGVFAQYNISSAGFDMAAGAGDRNVISTIRHRIQTARNEAANAAFLPAED